MYMIYRWKKCVFNFLMVEIMYRCLGEVIDFFDLVFGVV